MLKVLLKQDGPTIWYDDVQTPGNKRREQWSKKGEAQMHSRMSQKLRLFVGRFHSTRLGKGVQDKHTLEWQVV